MAKLRAFSESISIGSRGSHVSSFYSSFGHSPLHSFAKKPTATFLGWQPDVPPRPSIPLYNIVGGPSHGATVSAKILKKMGIKVPKIPGNKLISQKTAKSTIIKVLKTISKKSGIKLSLKTIFRIASKLSPWLMGVSIAVDVLEFLVTHKGQVSPELMKILREERVSLEDRDRIRKALKTGKFGESINPRIPLGDNYHSSVGWY